MVEKEAKENLQDQAVTVTRLVRITLVARANRAAHLRMMVHLQETARLQEMVHPRLNKCVKCLNKKNFTRYMIMYLWNLTI